MANDLQFTNLPLLSTFLKYHSRAYVGPQPESTPDDDGKRANGVAGVVEPSTELSEGVEELVVPEAQVKIREMFVNYFNQASKTLVKGQVVSIPVKPRSHVETARAGQTEPRGVYQIRGDF